MEKVDRLREAAQAVVKAWEHPGAFTVVDPAIKALDAALRAAALPAPRSVETAGLDVERLRKALVDVALGRGSIWTEGNTETRRVWEDIAEEIAAEYQRLSDPGDTAASRSGETAGDGRHPDEVYADELERKQRDLDATIDFLCPTCGRFEAEEDSFARLAAPRSDDLAGLPHFQSVDPEALCPQDGFPSWAHDPAQAVLMARSVEAPEARS